MGFARGRLVYRRSMRFARYTVSAVESPVCL